MPDSHPTLTITRRDDTPLVLTPKEFVGELSGLSAKGVYVDQYGNEYYVKEPKRRRVTEIFKTDPVFNELVAEAKVLLSEETFDPAIPLTDALHLKIEGLTVEKRAQFNLIQEKLNVYNNHVRDLILSNTALEVLASRLAAAMMGELAVIPRNYICLHEGNPLIVSPSVGDLREFLSEHEDIVPAKGPDYWLTHVAPRFSSLVGTAKEARILGQAYFVALLFGHYDLINNINLSNSGYVAEADGSLKMSTVDWGNSLGVGFSGLSADEGAFRNPEFFAKSSPPLVSEPTGREVTGFEYMMPFDELVYPLLPRQVVPDLFDLTATDCPDLRKAQREGFYEACDQALSMLETLSGLVPSIIKDTLTETLSVEDNRRVKKALPEFITCETHKTGTYTLTNVLQARIRSLQEMRKKLEEGKTWQGIARERLAVITKSQITSVGFFAPPSLRVSEEKSLPDLLQFFRRLISI